MYPETFLVEEERPTTFEAMHITGPHLFWNYFEYIWPALPVPFHTSEVILPEAFDEPEILKPMPEEILEEMGRPPSIEDESRYDAPPGPLGPMAKRARPSSPPAITIGLSALQEAANALAILLTDATIVPA